MTSVEKQNLRLAILKVLDANQTKFGLSIDGIALRLTPFGFPEVTHPEVEVAMGLLEQEKMIGRLAVKLGPGTSAWRITDEGRSYLAENF